MKARKSKTKKTRLLASLLGGVLFSLGVSFKVALFFKDKKQRRELYICTYSKIEWVRVNCFQFKNGNRIKAVVLFFKANTWVWWFNRVQQYWDSVNIKVKVNFSGNVSHLHYLFIMIGGKNQKGCQACARSRQGRLRRSARWTTWGWWSRQRSQGFKEFTKVFTVVQCWVFTGSERLHVLNLQLLVGSRPGFLFHRWGVRAEVWEVRSRGWSRGVTSGGCVKGDCATVAVGRSETRGGGGEEKEEVAPIGSAARRSRDAEARDRLKLSENIFLCKPSRGILWCWIQKPTTDGWLLANFFKTFDELQLFQNIKLK